MFAWLPVAAWCCLPRQCIPTLAIRRSLHDTLKAACGHSVRNDVFEAEVTQNYHDLSRKIPAAEIIRSVGGDGRISRVSLLTMENVKPVPYAAILRDQSRRAHSV